MKPFSDKVICLGKVTYSESSQIVTLFSAEHGKLRGIAKGARREKGGFSGGFDLLYLGAADYIPPRGSSELGTLTNFYLENSFVGLRADLLALNSALFLAEFTADMTEDMDPHPELFESLSRSLSRLEAGDPAPDVMLNYEQYLMKNTGHQPCLDCCCLCGGETDSLAHPYFSSSAGGLVCDGCCPSVEEKRLTEKKVVDLLRKGLLPAEGYADIIIKAHGLLCYHKRAITGRPGKVMGFLNSLLLARMNRK